MSHKEFDLIWDRGSLVAINVADRDRYSKVMNSLLSKNGLILIQGLEREKGPPGAPHNLTETHLKELYEDRKIEYLDETVLDDPVKVERMGHVRATYYAIK
jgi:hypothetical protein